MLEYMDHVFQSITYIQRKYCDINNAALHIFFPFVFFFYSSNKY